MRKKRGGLRRGQVRQAGGGSWDCLDVRGGAHAQWRPQWHRWRLAAALSSSTSVPREGRSVATSRCFIWRSFAETLRSNSTGSAASGLGRGLMWPLATTTRVSSARAAASRSLKKRWHPRQSTCAEVSSYPPPPPLSCYRAMP